MVNNIITRICVVLPLVISVHANAESFRIRYQDELPTIDARIGNRLHSLMVDTGSSNGLHLYISNILNNSGIDIQEIEPLVATDLSGKVYNNRQWESSNIFLSSVQLNKINIVEFEPWGWGADSDISNTESEVIGLGSFSDKIVSINFLKNTLVFNDKIPAKTTRSLPFELSPSGILINVVVNNKMLKFVVDTGATESIVFYESLPVNVSYHGCNYIDSNAGRLECNVVSARFFESSKETENIYAVAISSNYADGFGFDGILGLNFLKKHNMTLDMKNKIIYIID